MNVPVDELYETDTIFSQEGDLPENYLYKKLADVESETEDGNCPDKLVSDASDDDDSFPTLLEHARYQQAGDFQANRRHNLFDELVNTEKYAEFSGPSGFVYDDTYDIAKDTFRYGRVTRGVSYQLKSGKMQEETLEKVKKQDENNDNVLVSKVTEDEKTHRVTTEVTISLDRGFSDLYETQMPKYFEYRQQFPEISGIWTILLGQEEYKTTKTYELQVSICAALNSRKFMIMCIGVDEYNTVTGVEMTAEQRVIFRMALTRAVAGEFQPPLIKLPPKQLTGISAMKQDVANFTSSIDVLFIPIFQVPEENLGEPRPKRFLIVVRVKETTEKLYQLSSGKVYIEEGGVPMELSSLNEAHKLLILDKDEESKGSLFSENVELFHDSEFESEEEDEPESEPEQIEEPQIPEPTPAQSIQTVVAEKIIPKLETEKNKLDKIWKHISPSEKTENIILAVLCFASISFGIYKLSRRS
ncbi:unnamed protein product [Caenorhabditis angaria]|uniref:Uncharacterized protein n=1 Tax=Caenorhabditis angaria TaxID=860376 RepID=A0A9P1N6H2_9PELO|nr:unnamed protein product [Caenorhabditis angaria]